MIGYGPNSGGTFPAGGSMSNFIALIMARDAMDKNVCNRGNNQLLIAYTSIDSHYSNAKNAEYLYQTDGDDYNLGKFSFQYGRRNDALKFWTLWKAVGTNGLSDIVDHQFHLAAIARQYIRNHPDYTLYSSDDSIAICFNYKNINAQTLCTSLYEKNDLMVSLWTINLFASSPSMLIIVKKIFYLFLIF